MSGDRCCKCNCTKEQCINGLKTTCRVLGIVVSLVWVLMGGLLFNEPAPEDFFQMCNWLSEAILLIIVGCLGFYLEIRSFCPAVARSRFNFAKNRIYSAVLYFWVGSFSMGGRASHVSEDFQLICQFAGFAAWLTSLLNLLIFWAAENEDEDDDEDDKQSAAEKGKANGVHGNGTTATSNGHASGSSGSGSSGKKNGKSETLNKKEALKFIDALQQESTELQKEIIDIQDQKEQVTNDLHDAQREANQLKAAVKEQESANNRLMDELEEIRSREKASTLQYEGAIDKLTTQLQESKEREHATRILFEETVAKLDAVRSGRGGGGTGTPTHVSEANSRGSTPKDQNQMIGMNHASKAPQVYGKAVTGRTRIGCAANVVTGAEMRWATGGPQVELLENGAVAKHRGRTGEELYGGAIASMPVPQFSEGRYFEVKLERRREGKPPDGLTIGVSSISPAEVPEMPETVDCLGECWVAGYDGQIWNGGREDWSEIDWNPSELQVGDRVGVLVTPSGSLEIYENGRKVIDEPADIPGAGVIYPVIDLLGSALAVRLIVGAEPPNSQRRPGSKDSSGRLGINSQSTSQAGEFTGFVEPVLLGNSATACLNRGVSATYVIAKEEMNGDFVGYGGLLSNGVIPTFSQGKYFEVCVDKTRNTEPDGMVIGVTTRKEGQMEVTVDFWLPSWVAGFDGQIWDGGAKVWNDVDWNPSALKVGDHVGALVTPKGELEIFVNGTLVVHGCSGIPFQEPLYAILDLMGNTMGVTLIVGATPPNSPNSKRRR